MPRVETKFFSDVMPDNDIIYMQHLCDYLDSIDELATVEIRKQTNSYHFRIAPSAPQYSQIILEGVLNFHNMLGIIVDLSKSIKTSNTIDFQINLDFK